MDKYGFSEIERKIINAQIKRRAEMRKTFLRLRSDPHEHALEKGHLFDPAIQRFMSLKVSHLEFFQATASSIKFGVCGFIMPLIAYGYLIWNQRTKTEKDIRSGKLKYCDRLFKFK